MIEHHLMSFTANTRSLVTTERSTSRVCVIAVGPDATSLDCTTCTVSRVHVASPHASTESIQSVICNFHCIVKTIELGDGYDWSKDFFLEYPHLVITFKNCWSDVIAPCQLSTQICLSTSSNN